MKILDLSEVHQMNTWDDDTYTRYKINVQKCIWILYKSQVFFIM